MSQVVDSIGSMFGGGPSAPATPDYTSAANATAANNLAMARQALAANRVNQTTPYGNLNYTQSGTDSYGNPMWSATQTLSPNQQSLLTGNENIGLGLQGSSSGLINNFAKNAQTDFSGGNLPSYGINPNETYSDAIMRRLQPQIDMQQKQFDAQMANQGIPVGSEAYQNAARQFQQGQNDQRTSAIVGGMQTGLQANQQQYGQNLNTYNTNINTPINALNAIRSGSQVTNPTYINPAQQATTAGADVMGATQAGYNANMGAYNAQQTQNAGMTSGLMGLGGSLGAAAIMASDIRMKENITPVGVANNGLTIYKYEYKPEFKDHKLAGHGIHYGYMAQEVEQVFPYAVHTLNDGYKVVDYGVING